VRLSGYHFPYGGIQCSLSTIGLRLRFLFYLGKIAIILEMGKYTSTTSPLSRPFADGSAFSFRAGCSDPLFNTVSDPTISELYVRPSRLPYLRSSQ